MDEFRKDILRSSSMTDDFEQDEDYKRIDVAEKILNELQYVYYGYDASYLPYTHDRIESDDGITYRFNPITCEAFISELLDTIDEQYWRNYPVPDELFDKFNEDTKQFYRSFLYLAIRIAALKLPLSQSKDYHAEVGKGTFKDLHTLAHSIVIPYSEAVFHRQFEIGIQDTDLPQMLYDIGRICSAIGKENIFLHASISDEEQQNALKEDAANALEHIRILANEKGIDVEQLQASEQYLKESAQYLLSQENDKLKEYLGDFEDEEAFIRHASTYRNLLFRYNDYDTEQYIDTALKLFLLRNNLSALSTERRCKDSHNSVAAVIENIRKMKD